MKKIAFLGVLAVFACTHALAQESSSARYSGEAPVLAPGGYSTSASFGLQSVLGQMNIGTTAASSFGTNVGFPFYPQVSTPAVTASAGDGEVALSWTASEGFLGWTVSGYDVGQGTVSGGPYSYSSVGSVTSSTRTGLTNGTAYYFVVLPKDASGNRIATSTEASATPASSGSSGGSGGGGGGGGGGAGSGTETGSGSTVNFSGRAYPRRTITLLKDAAVAGSTVAGADARFSLSVRSVAAGNYIFSVYSEDKDGTRSSMQTFPVSVNGTSDANVTGIFLAPTITTDKAQVRYGDTIAIFGQSQPNSAVTITVNSSHELYAQAKADEGGVYLYNLDSQLLEIGDHTAKSKSALVNEISAFSAATHFKVGYENVKKERTVVARKGDGNGDGKVNLVDYSVVAYWYGRANPPTKADLNNDGRVNLVDLSILAYNWTG